MYSNRGLGTSRSLTSRSSDVAAHLAPYLSTRASLDTRISDTTTPSLNLGQLPSKQDQTPSATQTPRRHAPDDSWCVLLPAGTASQTYSALAQVLTTCLTVLSYLQGSDSHGQPPSQPVDLRITLPGPDQEIRACSQQASSAGPVDASQVKTHLLCRHPTPGKASASLSGQTKRGAN